MLITLADPFIGKEGAFQAECFASLLQAPRDLLIHGVIVSFMFFEAVLVRDFAYHPLNTCYYHAFNIAFAL